MRSRMFQMTLVVVSLTIMISTNAVGKVATPQASQDDKSYTGRWVGTYVNQDGESEKVVFTLSKDQDGSWRGTVTYTNQDGEQTAELKSLRIEGAKFSARIDSPNGAQVISLEGEFNGTRFEGTYSVSEKDSTEIMEKGSWKTTKAPPGTPEKT